MHGCIPTSFAVVRFDNIDRTGFYFLYFHISARCQGAVTQDAANAAQREADSLIKPYVDQTALEDVK